MTSRSQSGAQVVLVFGLKSKNATAPRAAFLVYHPERRTLVPRVFPLQWRRLEGLIRFGVVRFKEDLYFLGGYDVIKKKWKRQVLRYDLKRGHIYVCEKMNTPRVDFTPFVFEGRIYCCGGRSRDDQLTRASEYFEPMLGRWYRDTSLPEPCAHYGVVVADKVVYLIGGIVPGELATQRTSSHFWRMTREFQTNEDKLDVLVSVWTEIPTAAYPSSHGVYRHRCVFCTDERRIYVIGGIRCGLGKADTLDASSGDAGLYYLNVNDLPSPKSLSSAILWRRRYLIGCKRASAGVCCIGHRIFIVGGEVLHTSQPSVLGDVNETEEAVNGSTSEEMNFEQKNKDVPMNNYDPMLPADNVVGCYNWATKAWTPLFTFQKDSIDLDEVCCVHLEPNMPMKEFDFDRLDWFLQWALW